MTSSNLHLQPLTGAKIALGIDYGQAIGLKPGVNQGLRWLASSVKKTDELQACLVRLGYSVENFESLMCRIYEVDTIMPGCFIGDSSSDVVMATSGYEYLKACLLGLRFDNSFNAAGSESVANTIYEALSVDMVRLPLMLTGDEVTTKIAKWRLSVNV